MIKCDNCNYAAKYIFKPTVEKYDLSEDIHSPMIEMLDTNYSHPDYGDKQTLCNKCSLDEGYNVSKDIVDEPYKKEADEAICIGCSVNIKEYGGFCEKCDSKYSCSACCIEAFTGRRVSDEGHVCVTDEHDPDHPLLLCDRMMERFYPSEKKADKDNG